MSTFSLYKTKINQLSIPIIGLILLWSIFIGLTVPTIVAYLGITIGETLSLLLLMITLMPPIIGVVFYRDKIDIFHPVFLFAVVMFFGFVFSPIALLYEQEAKGISLFYREQYVPALLLAVVGVCAFYFGYFLSVTKIYDLASNFLNRFFLQDKEAINQSFVFHLAVFCWVLIFGGFLLWFFLAGISFSTLNVFDEGVYGLTLADKTDIHVVYLFLLRLSFASICSVAWCYRTTNLVDRMLLFGMIGSSLMLVLISSNRSMLFGFIIIGVATYYLNRDTRPNLKILFMIAMLLIPLTGLIVFARGARGIDGVIEFTAEEGVLSAFVEEFTERGTFTPLVAMMHIVPEYYDFVGFDIFGFVLYAPIPRFLWPDKPSLSEGLLNFRFAYKYWHAPGLFGTYYAGFSFIGPIVMLILYGIISDIIYRFYLEDRAHAFRQVLLATWLPMMYTMVFRGEPIIIITRVIYQIGPLFLFYILLRLWSNGFHYSKLES